MTPSATPPSATTPSATTPSATTPSAESASPATTVPLLLLALPFLQLLQVLLGQLDDVRGLLLGGQGGEGPPGAPVQGLARGGTGQALTEALVDGLALQQLGPETSTTVQSVITALP